MTPEEYKKALRDQQIYAAFDAATKKKFDLIKAQSEAAYISQLKLGEKPDFNKIWESTTKEVEGITLDGNIIITESLKEDSGFKVKRAGSDENSPVCTFNGKPIYRKTEYSDVEGETNTLIAHTNGEEIKAHNAMKVSAKALN